ncbi:anti-sigma factor family protein [Archangium lipolyticum]|uniref:anti-sigma factor family protein n=1 Tax=Archangium lipolyticum TaxID=2970465 RepID=UPI003899502B
MDCPDETTLSDFLEGLLEVEHRVRVLEHMEGCSECQLLVALSSLKQGRSRDWRRRAPPLPRRWRSRGRSAHPVWTGPGCCAGRSPWACCRAGRRTSSSLRTGRPRRSPRRRGSTSYRSTCSLNQGHTSKR